ncbi:MAG: type II toxin-antitoxin system ParD family antitoxin [Gammaproteobacteria bacterium]|nr:MAG: type II toxin-antitoxin system ParD family antitoxin [Gammaproteobacteria bacterium]
MARNTPVALGDHFDEFVAEKINAGLRKLEDDETKLQLLRDKLKAGEYSQLVDDFDGANFIAELNKKHLK